MSSEKQLQRDCKPQGREAAKALGLPPQHRAMPSPSTLHPPPSTNPERRRPNSLSRSILPLLFAICHLPFAISSHATTVTGNLKDLHVAPLQTKISFTPTNLVLVTTNGLSVGPAITITATNGSFSTVLDPGDYTVCLPLVPGRDCFRISVMATNVAMDITNFMPAVVTYTWTNNLNYLVRAVGSDTPGVLGSKLMGTSPGVITTNAGSLVVNPGLQTNAMRFFGQGNDWWSSWSIAPDYSIFYLTNAGDHGGLALTSDGVLSATAEVDAPSFVGGGSGLLNLNASQLSSGTIPFARLGISNTVIQVFSNGTVLAPWGWINTVGTKTMGFQEAIDALPQYNQIAPTNVFGGGTILVAPGFYIWQTNVVYNNDNPWALDMHSAGGRENTEVLYTGKTNSPHYAYFGPKNANPTAQSFDPNATHQTQIEISGFTFSWVTNGATNFFLGLDCVNRYKVHDCGFWPYYVQTNNLGISPGGRHMGIDDIMFDQLQGVVPIAINPLSGNPLGGNGEIYGNEFYGGGAAILNLGIRCDIHDNWFFANGTVSIGGVTYYHTNVWTRDSAGEDNWAFTAPANLSSGATIVSSSSGPCLIHNNRFAIDGPCVYGNLCVLSDNTYEGCHSMVMFADGANSPFGNWITTSYTFLENYLGDRAFKTGGALNKGNGIPPSFYVKSAGSAGSETQIPDENSIADYSTNAFAGILVMGADLVAARPQWSNNVVVFGRLSANGSGITNLTAQTGGITWATNSTLPNNTSTIRSWLSITNQSGKVCKIPVYE
jgi:hypothetical protein